VVRLLLDHKADVDAKTMSGKTALYLAAGNGHEAVVQLLLKHMADVDENDNDGRTALSRDGDEITRLP
jgi:ankyrin repeat protein